MALVPSIEHDFVLKKFYFWIPIELDRESNW